LEAAKKKKIPLEAKLVHKTPLTLNPKQGKVFTTNNNNNTKES